MIYIKCCYYLACIILLIKVVKYLLNIYQQEHYHTSLFVKSIKNFYLKRFDTYIMYLILLVALINNIYLYPLPIILILISILKDNKTIMKAKITPRIIRLIIGFILLNLIPYVMLPAKLHELIFSIQINLSFFSIILTNFLLIPIENLIKKHYLNKSIKKLRQNKNLIKVAITGSFGKTSTKTILYEILKSKYYTLKTPKSYNTLMGLSKTINEHLKQTTEVAIFEMGATRKNEIMQMTKFIKPDIGIITDIGPQHLETFKSIENVISAKLELIKYMKEDNFFVLNGDNPYIIDYVNNLNENKIKENLYLYGFKKENDIYPTNIKIDNNKTTFDLYYLNKHIKVTTKLLGKHNILNILATYGIILQLRKLNINISDKEFINLVSSIEQLKHRLSYKKLNNIHIYDNAYSSNIVGFLNSIEVIKQLQYKKIIITPGIVDTGKKTKEINETVAKEIINTFDEIYIIDNVSGKYIYNYIINNTKDKKVSLVTSFIDAYKEVIKKEEESCLLIENDLPDNYLARG